jgi:hypothetical protein
MRWLKSDAGLVPCMMLCDSDCCCNWYLQWYFQTTVDASMQDEHGRHNSALFVQWSVPLQLWLSLPWPSRASGWRTRLLTIDSHVAIRVPYDIAGSSWIDEEAGYVSHLLKICDQFAPGAHETLDRTTPSAPYLLW